MEVRASATELSVSGFVMGSFSFGTGLASAGLRDIASITLDESLRWARRFGGPDHDPASGLVTSPTDFVMVGTFLATADLGMSLTSAGSNDLYISRLLVQ